MNIIYAETTVFKYPTLDIPAVLDIILTYSNLPAIVLLLLLAIISPIVITKSRI